MRQFVVFLMFLLVVGIATVSGGGRIAGQEATDTREEETTLLFVQLARGGTFNPEATSPAQATMTLEGLWAETVAFADRPGRFAYTMDTAAFLALDGLFDGANSPNAAVVISEAASDTADVIIVELRDPVYDPAAGSLRYAVTVLDRVPAGLASWSARADPALPIAFSRVTVFVDGIVQGNRGPQGF